MQSLKIAVLVLTSFFLVSARADGDVFAMLQGKKIVASFKIKDGTQNYLCVDSKWKLYDANATLIDETSGAVVGHHLFVANPQAAGTLMPAWQLLDGSHVTGKKLSGKPSARGGVDQLALELTSNNTGLLRTATHAERVDTVSGVAPAQPCAPENASLKVPYDARYVFFDVTR